MSYAIWSSTLGMLKKVRGRTGNANNAIQREELLCKRHFTQTTGVFYPLEQWLGTQVVPRGGRVEQEPDRVASGARQIDFADLPEALREEVMAVLAPRRGRVALDFGGNELSDEIVEASAGCC